MKNDGSDITSKTFEETDRDFVAYFDRETSAQAVDCVTIYDFALHFQKLFLFFLFYFLILISIFSVRGEICMVHDGP